MRVLFRGKIIVTIIELINPNSELTSELSFELIDLSGKPDRVVKVFLSS